jgi:hypothetical protein
MAHLCLVFIARSTMECQKVQRGNPMTRPEKWLRRLSRRLSDEGGTVLVLTSVGLVLFFALAALAVDLTMHAHRRQHLWDSVDAAALAGASQLPDNAVAADALARSFAVDNDPELGSDLDVEFRCVVGDRDGDGQPDAGDVPAVCTPGAGATIAAPPFVCDGGRCISACVPTNPGARCNTIVLDASKTTDYSFAPVIDIDQGSTELRVAACRGTCGGARTGPLDLVLIIDRTTSMSSTDLQNAKDAALAMLDYFNPAMHHVALANLGAADPTDSCDGLPVTSGGVWLNIGLSSDYKSNPDLDIDGDGTPDLDSTSPLVAAIRCLQHETGTDLGSPIHDTTFGKPDALGHLQTAGRPGVKKGIILLSDGEAARPGDNPCQYALDRAAEAKAAGVEIFTIGFGIGSKTCHDDSGAFASASVPVLLAAMASGPTDDNCLAGGENTDGDHFFCEPKSGDLADVFVAAASQFGGSTSLIYLPPGA